MLEKDPEKRLSIEEVYEVLEKLSADSEKEVELAICGIENQSVVEKNMPFHVIGYDGTAYRSQLLEERKKILPVVTIVLYFGTDRHWNSEKNIKSLMEIPEGLDRFVNDYSMQV